MSTIITRCHLLFSMHNLFYLEHIDFFFCLKVAPACCIEYSVCPTYTNCQYLLNHAEIILLARCGKGAWLCSKNGASTVKVCLETKTES